MNYYQEITLLPDPSTASLDFLWQKVYQQLHLALVENKLPEGSSAIGVAFPEYGSVGFRLGRKIRLIAKEQSALQQLDITTWLAKLADYTHVKSIQPVPAQSTPVSYIRQHVKGEKRIESDMQKKAELWAQKTGQSVDNCLAILAKSKPDHFNRLPFIWMESLHNKTAEKRTRPFPLFIKRVVCEQEQSGSFSCYGLGLSANPQLMATVPHF